MARADDEVACAHQLYLRFRRARARAEHLRLVAESRALLRRAAEQMSRARTILERIRARSRLLSGN